MTEVIAVEPEPYLRKRAKRAAESASFAFEVVAGQADRLPFEDESVDAVVSSLVLSSVSEQATALHEMRRVLRPGGERRYYEHVAPPNQIGLGLRRAADATFWPRAFGNCHATRDTQAAIEQAGLTIEAADDCSSPEWSLRTHPRRRPSDVVGSSAYAGEGPRPDAAYAACGP